MAIAIQSSDLDHARIDGTRVYLSELLKRFGPLRPQEDFLLYHAREFNPRLAPPSFPNYQERKLPFPWAWMQTRFAWELFWRSPAKLFLPIQAAPLFLPKALEVTATIHDLAWKKYPETFPLKHRLKLNILLERAVRRADKLICVSEATKRDLLEAYPCVSEERTRVIHHGFDGEFYGAKIDEEDLRAKLGSFSLEKGKYILYVGALQPRKNLVRLIAAFEDLQARLPEAVLVLAGEEAWLASEIKEAAKVSKAAARIIFTGRVGFDDLRILYRGARFFVFPSLYEGFGLPLLEAFASGAPVLTADNSSLREVAGEGALYCQAESVPDITEKLGMLWQDEALRERLILAGARELGRFSWDKCAEETLDFLMA